MARTTEIMQAYSKQFVKNGMYDLLYEPYLDHASRRLQRIVVRNTAITGKRHMSLIHKGILYNFDTEAPPRLSNRLCPDLKREIDEHLADVHQVINNESRYVMGFITAALNKSNSKQDWFKLLPICLHPTLRTIPVIELPEEIDIADFQGFLSDNEKPIQLIRQRLVTNLLY